MSPGPEFARLAAAGVERVVVSSNGQEITGCLKKPLKNGRRWFQTTTVPEGIASNLERRGAQYTGQAPSLAWSSVLSWIVPTLPFSGLWALLFRRVGAQTGSNGFMSIGKSKPRLYVESNTKATFADVAGSHEAKEELQEVIGFLKNPERYARFGGQVPKGVLLVGPPGTGKTLRACGRRRGGRSIPVDLRLRVHPDVRRGRRGARPPAVLRPGRFDRQILVDRPDKKDRVEIAAVHMRRVRTAPDASPEKIAELTVGFTGADIANLVNEAALIATRRGAEAVEVQDLTAASERIIAGFENRNRVLSPAERKIVAYHEMGHALVDLSLPGTDRVHKVSIIPRGLGALGYTIRRPTEDPRAARRGGCARARDLDPARAARSAGEGRRAAPRARNAR